MNGDRLLWRDRCGLLELVRADRATVARVQQLDSSRWLAVVFFDAPGGGAASVQPDREVAVEWVSETVASFFACERLPALVKENQ